MTIFAFVVLAMVLASVAGGLYLRQFTFLIGDRARKQNRRSRRQYQQLVARLDQAGKNIEHLQKLIEAGAAGETSKKLAAFSPPTYKDRMETRVFEQLQREQVQLRDTAGPNQRPS